jgi:hypothetical protein
MRTLISNWRLGIILGVSTGQHYSVTTGVDNALTGVNTAAERANQVLANPYCVVQSPTCWLNPAAFSAVPSGTYGNMGVGTIVGPGTVTLDMSLSRIFAIRERYKLEFRAEAFNVPNTFRPGSTPSGSSIAVLQTAFNAGNFGQMQIAADPRIMQFALKFGF